MPPRDKVEEMAPTGDADGKFNNNNNNNNNNNSNILDAAMEAALKKSLLETVWNLQQHVKQKHERMNVLEEKVTHLEKENAALQRNRGRWGITRRLELMALVQSATAKNVEEARVQYRRYVEDFLAVLGDIEEIETDCEVEWPFIRSVGQMLDNVEIRIAAEAKRAPLTGFESQQQPERMCGEAGMSTRDEKLYAQINRRLARLAWTTAWRGGGFSVTRKIFCAY